MKKSGYGESHAKVILIGEHAVVYGHPGLALPFFPLTVKITVYPDQAFFLDAPFYKGSMQTLPDDFLFLFAFVEQLTQSLALPPLRIIIENDIPTSAGLGSSAAIADALTQACFDLAEETLTNAKRFEWTQVSEKMVHGNPSGIDALMVQAKTPYWFAKGKQPKPIKMSVKGTFLILDSGIQGKTKEAIARVAKQYISNTAQVHLESIGLMVPLVEEALMHDDPQDLARLMNQTHYHLQELDLSLPQLDAIIQQCLDLGATGGKLTGGGLGGSVLIYVPDTHIAEKIYTTMKPQIRGIWMMTL